MEVDLDEAKKETDALKEELKKREEELAGCRSTITDLTTQLSSSHRAREEQTLKAAKAIDEVGERALHQKDSLMAWVSNTAISSADDYLMQDSD